MKIFLFWDIDGTLLSTGRAGIIAWEDAAFAVTGRKVELEKLNTAGLTDVQVGERILEACGTPAAPDVLKRLVRLYEDHLPAALPKRQGQVMPGVREILEATRNLPDVVTMLLTGNTRAGAKAKLTHYRLDGFFPDGAFADDSTDRAAIARTAFERARAAHGPFPLENAFVIGDTPHDIDCAKAVGARVVAVATGPYSVEQLRAHAPWWVVERLPSPDVFLKKIGYPGFFK